MNRNLSKNIFLGCNWLQENDVRIYYDLAFLFINDRYVSLEEVFLIRNIAHMTFDTILKLQTATLCLVRISDNLEK